MLKEKIRVRSKRICVVVELIKSAKNKVGRNLLKFSNYNVDLDSAALTGIRTRNHLLLGLVP